MHVSLAHFLLSTILLKVLALHEQDCYTWYQETTCLL